jgi:hypothetical protein
MAKYIPKPLKDLSTTQLRDLSMQYDAQRIDLYTKPKMGIKVKKRLALLAEYLAQMNDINRNLQWRGEPPESITLVHDLHDDPLVAADWVRFAKYLKT